MTKGPIAICDCGEKLTHVCSERAKARKYRVWVCLRCGTVYRLVRVEGGST